jgi:hypothetical protein
MRKERFSHLGTMNRGPLFCPLREESARRRQATSPRYSSRVCGNTAIKSCS